MTKPGLWRLGNKKWLIVGLCFIGGGILLCVTWPAPFSYILNSNLVLRPGGHVFQIWKDPPVPIYMTFYMFNWTNPEEVRTNKPNLVEMGPYTFREFDEKTNITWNDNGTVTFRKKRVWHFVPEMSNGSLDDMVTTLNPIALSAARSVKNWSFLLKKSVSLTISTHKQNIHVTHTVGDILFHGYPDPLLDLVKKMPNIAGIDIPYDKFAWFYLRNQSELFEGVYNIDTGSNGLDNYGKLHYWNYDVRTTFYDGDCALVKGTAGDLFPPNQKKTYVEMFSPDLCRSLALKYTEEAEVRGIKGYKYVAGEEVVDNGTLDASNECYCDGECSPSGVINVTTCRLGAPGFVSYPHFHLADPYYRQLVTGMNPDPEKHGFYLILEPDSGVPLEVAARLQVNLLLAPSESISLYKNVPKVFFPMIWFEQRVKITSILAFLLKLTVYIPIIGTTMSVILITAGLLIISLNIYLHWINKRNADTFKESGLCNATAIPLIQNGVTKKEEIIPKGELLMKSS